MVTGRHDPRNRADRLGAETAPAAGTPVGKLAITDALQGRQRKWHRWNVKYRCAAVFLRLNGISTTQVVLRPSCAAVTDVLQGRL